MVGSVVTVLRVPLVQIAPRVVMVNVIVVKGISVAMGNAEQNVPTAVVQIAKVDVVLRATVVAVEMDVVLKEVALMVRVVMEIFVVMNVVQI